MKPALSPKERITCAYMHYVLGREQNEIAQTMGVNPGRVNEACLSIMWVAENPSIAERRAHRRGEQGLLFKY